jgi:5-methylcytosine-specific restriction endonuclease McrA
MAVNRALFGRLTCAICREPIHRLGEVTVDHIKPLAQGGADDFDNLQLAHAACNWRKGCK